ncbi:MAG: hypothetical protein PHI23_00185 [Candidatus Peribacteraceae bacterium]|nr:hypothetical protein [Candidatus Peribacteraceae bacterium]
MAKQQPATTTDEKLDLIIEHLRHLDNRDRWRTIGGFLRSLLHIAYLVIIVASIWYTFKYSDVILKKITEQAAEQAARITQQNTGNLMQELNKYLKP